MAKEQPVTTAYYADYLGAVNEAQSKLIGKLLDPGGLAKVNRRLPYIMREPVSVSVLTELGRAIDRQIGEEQFITPYRSPNELTMPHSARWHRFQGAVAEVICEVFLKNGGELQGRVLLTGQELSEQATLLAERNQSVWAEGTNFSCNGHQHAFPDGVAANVDIGSAKVTTIYEYKSTATGNDQKKPKK